METLEHVMYYPIGNTSILVDDHFISEIQSLTDEAKTEMLDELIYAIRQLLANEQENNLKCINVLLTFTRLVYHTKINISEDEI